MKRLSVVLSILVVFSMLFAACTTTATEEPAVEEPAAEEPAAEEPAEEEAAEEPMEEASDKVEIRWFVGLGTGQQPEQVEAQEAVVEAFNASQDEIELVLEIVNFEVSVDTLSTQIAAGNAPDIVGPVGIGGSNAFSGLWLDLEPLVDSSGIDLSDFEPAQIDFYRVEGEGLVGLPFAVFPSFMYYNTTLFDEAGLAYPPHTVGEGYDGQDWNWDTVKEIGQVLTVDAEGNDATMEGFDPDNVTQFGFYSQFTDPRGEATFFGSGSFVDADGNATISDEWREAFQWYYDGMWTDHFIPTDAYINSDLFGNGNAFGSGNVAMLALHLWCHGCYEGDDWDIGVLPSNTNGEPTAKLHADTFRILNSTEHPEEAFTVLSYLLDEAAPDLLQVYGGMPARSSLQDAFFETLDADHPQGVDWQVAVEMLSYPDNPNHESNMPDFNRATERVGQFQSLYRGTADLDLQAELDILVADLQAIFDAAE